MKILKIIFTVLILIGFGVSFYLTSLHYAEKEPVCGISFSNCDAVLTSEYSVLFGIPLALLGIIFYSTTFVLFLILIFKKMTKENKQKMTQLIFALEFAGVLFSVYFTYLQFFVIKAFCPYCLTSAVVTLLLFLLSSKLRN